MTPTSQDQLYIARISALAELELLDDPSNLDALLHRIVEITQQLLPASGGAGIILFDREKGQYYAAATTVPGQNPDTVLSNIRPRGGATRWIIDHRQPVIVPDIRLDPFGANPQLKEHGLRAYAGFPILIKGEAIGALYAMCKSFASWTDADLAFMRTLAARAAQAIHLASMYQTILQLTEEDELTGLYNRRGFFHHAEIALEHSRRYQHPVCALGIDVNQFKRFNDHYGHAIGDQVLQMIGAAIQRTCRSTDIPGRLGGDEFAVILLESNLDTARMIAERILHEVRQGSVSLPEPVHLSIGIAAANPSDENLESLLHKADQAMYQAKQRAARTSVSIYQAPSD